MAWVNLRSWVNLSKNDQKTPILIYLSAVLWGPKWVNEPSHLPIRPIRVGKFIKNTHPKIKNIHAWVFFFYQTYPEVLPPE